MTSRILCEMKMIDLPSSVSDFMMSKRPSTSMSVRTAVGSSRITRSAPRNSTFMISTRCCMPMDMSPTFSSRSISMP